jgi:ABC-type Fe3+-hydroxamate transport system substrate-binding protein
MKTIRFFITLFLCCFFVSCQNKAYQDKDIEKGELRIVSLAQSISKELEDLGVSEKIVGATSFCAIAKANPELIVGTSTEVNVEKVLLLKPSLVVASVLTSQATINTLKNNGIPVYISPKMESFETICKHFLELGHRVGQDSLANEIVTLAEKKIDSLKVELKPNKKKKKVFFQIGANPLFTVIPNTYMNDFITFAGGENIAEGLTGGVITRESVLQKNPDIFFIVTMGIAGDQEKTTWESYKELNAVKNNKIFILDSEKACTPTVLTFLETMETIAKQIQ